MKQGISHRRNLVASHKLLDQSPPFLCSNQFTCQELTFQGQHSFGFEARVATNKLNRATGARAYEMLDQSWQRENSGLHLQRHCVRAVKEMDSKSIGLCPQGFESLGCRMHLPESNLEHLEISVSPMCPGDGFRSDEFFLHYLKKV